MRFFKRTAEFLSKNRRHVATAAFVAGFFVDILTFRSINLDTSEIILAGYLLIVAGSVLVLAAPPRLEEGGIGHHVRAWLPVVQQYAAGNLLSAFLVLYFSSGPFSASWPFLILVAIAALGNETFALERYRVPFQTTVLFFNLVLFSALAIPMAFGSLGLLMFLASLGAALVAFAFFFMSGLFFAHDSFRHNALRIMTGAFCISLLMLLLYVTHLMPPIPLSAKSIDVYHTVLKVGDAYVATDEPRSWYERFLDVGGVTLRLAEGEPAYVYTSVFAPAHFGADVVHEWELFDASKKEWIVKDEVRFPILGGRHDGYRGYSLIESPAPGRWRVSVKTSDGAVIGRTHLIIERVSAPVPLTEHMLE